MHIRRINTEGEALFLVSNGTSDIGKKVGDYSFLGFKITDQLFEHLLGNGTKDFPAHLVEDTRFPTGYRRTQDNFEGKGEFGKRCNVNACQREDSAFFYNSAMNKYYCYHCAYDIAGANRDMPHTIFVCWPIEDDLTFARI